MAPRGFHRNGAPSFCSIGERRASLDAMGNHCGRAEPKCPWRNATPEAKSIFPATDPAPSDAEPAPAQPKSTSIFPGSEDLAPFDAELYRATRGADFTFAGIVTLAKVVDVYDGDTIRFTFRYRGELIQYRVRMLGYDSPEMKPPRAHAERDAVVAAAHKARDALSELILGKVILAALGDFDKYGRVLATLYLADRVAALGSAVCVNDWMVRQGHGVPYAGGTKAAFTP